MSAFAGAGLEAVAALAMLGIGAGVTCAFLASAGADWHCMPSQAAATGPASQTDNKTPIQTHRIIMVLF
ncbi:hypothetical protein [Candidatus Phycosocius bacilliformis]|uniref:hypothetical protein n=1 Tax=Candidatus Phycosocius bacilliformis TaxID=1445552 RepID=UPI0010579EAD|nr:hypothetical protein [Candidatus Phycosocius bacilliformis]